MNKSSKIIIPIFTIIAIFLILFFIFKFNAIDFIWQIIKNIKIVG